MERESRVVVVFDVGLVVVSGYMTTWLFYVLASLVSSPALLACQCVPFYLPSDAYINPVVSSITSIFTITTAYVKTLASSGRERCGRYLPRCLIDGEDKEALPVQVAAEGCRQNSKLLGQQLPAVRSKCLGRKSVN